MHLLIPFAVPFGDSGRDAARALALPRLQALLARAGAARRDVGDAASLSPPHERAHAAALGLTGEDGRLPWAAWQIAALDSADPGTACWGLLTPCHWHLGSDAVTQGDPAALRLDDAASRALFAAVAPLFTDVGFACRWGDALRWHVAHPTLQGLACASIDRVVGRSVDRFLPNGPASAAWRRLHSEVQMLLHAHPVNAAREAAGLLPVNSVWLSGCGAWAPTDADPPAGDAPTVDTRLRAPALAGDWDAWVDGWRALDDALPAPSDTAAGDRLTVCGERGCAGYALGAAPWWRRWTGSRRGEAAPWPAWEGL